MMVQGRYIKRNKNEKIVAITDSVSYKMIDKTQRNDFTFAFKNITSKEAEKIINANHGYCIGAVGHSQFAKDLNRVLNINYHIPYGKGRERVHLTLHEGDYVVIISRISNRAGTYDIKGRYTPLVSSDDVMYTLAKVIPVPPTSFELSSLNQSVTV